MPIKRTEPRREWEIEDDVRTLQRAQEIKNDPSRLKDAQVMIQRKRAEENNILNMKPAANSSYRYNPASKGKLPLPEMHK